MKKTIALLLTSCFILFVNAQQDSTRRRQTPIDPSTLPANTLPVRTHDPVMIKQGDTYYLFATGMGVEIQSSKDLKTWKRVGRVFPDGQLPAWHKDFIPDQNGHLWAPDIHFSDGKYHLYYSVSAWMNFNSSIGYATNTTLDPNDPAYKWEDHGCVISYKNGRAKDIHGPYLSKEGKSWVDNDYTLFMAGDEAQPGKGHNGFLMENGRTKIVYHAYTRAANGASLLTIQPVHEDKGGWPTLTKTNKPFLSYSSK